MTLLQKKILETLVKNGVLTEKQKQEISKEADSEELSFEDYLISKYKVKHEDLLKAKSDASGFPPYDYESASAPITEETLSAVSYDTVRQYGLVPVAKTEKGLVVGMTDPTSIKSKQALRFAFLGSRPQPLVVVITDRDFSKITSLYRGLKSEVESALKLIETADLEETEAKMAGERPRTEALLETPATKIVQVILKHAMEGNASDIHIEPMRNNSRVRYRVDGALYSSLLLPLAVHNSIVARIKVLSNMRLDEQRIPQDGRFSAPLNGKPFDFRVSSFPTNSGEKIVMRVLDPSAAIVEFSDLGLTSLNKSRFEKAIEEPYGMILVSGPTGSGKSTTLYTALSRVNKIEMNVVSLEDPIEYHIEGVSQSQVRPEINYTFASGLRSVVRQDPDIIMVGEIRDAETAKLAVQAALTGHLLFTTIHTNNAVGVVPRLRDLGIEPFLLPSSILLAMAQRLVGRLCVHCKIEVEVPSKIVRLIDEELSKLPKDILKSSKISQPYKLWNAKGCPRCNNKRTKGRIGIFEALEMTEQLKSIIIDEDANVLKIEQEAKRQGMVSMKQDGIIKALQGTVSLEDVLRTVEEQLEEVPARG
jgi:type IV pilus assembly protein PilB